MSGSGFKKASSLNARTSKEKVRVIKALRHEYPLEKLLKAIGISKSAYYYQCNLLKAKDKYEELKEKIRIIYIRHKGRYGYRRIMMALRNMGENVNHKLVYKLMKTLGLKAVIRQKKYKKPINRNEEMGHAASNVLQRDFKANTHNLKWVTDITQFSIGTQKLYLSPIMDLFNAEIISYSIKRRQTFKLVKDMLDKALNKLGKEEKPIIHSDRGWHYRMRLFQQSLKEKGLIQSMSRKGNCFDNAAMESFFGTLKSECFYTQEFKNIDELEKALHEYIRYYNNDRIKMKLNGLSPVQYRIQSKIQSFST